MLSTECAYVRRYLDEFLDDGARSRVNLTRVSEHVGGCPTCFQSLSGFFRAVELPESAYLRETIDELALALYNLAKAMIRDVPARTPDDATDNVIITEEGGGSVDENVRAGHEMLDDAEDFVGSTKVGDMNLSELRSLLGDAERGAALRVDLALGLFGRVVQMASRYTSEAWNWIAVLCMQRGDFARAKAALARVFSAADGAPNTRSWAHCNLGYIQKAEGQLDKAVQSAQRSVALAEEDGKDPYFGRVALLYFLLLRKAATDRAQAERVLAEIVGTPEDVLRFRGHLDLPSVRPIRDVLRASSLADRHPGLFP